MAWTQVQNGSYERLLGDSEYALFLASQNAVGDMFLHLAVRAPAHYFRKERVRIAWSLIRRQNPLLMSKVLLTEDDLSTARFSFFPPSTPEGATEEADAALHFSKDTKQGTQWATNWADVLPLNVESRLSTPPSALGKAACKINYLQALSREIGGHSFSRIQRGPKHTILEEREFSEAQTSAILAKCKTNGVTVNHALIALSNIAWARCTTQTVELPMMLYTAANLRPHLAPQSSISNWYLALAYFTISLPAFLPVNNAGIWHRARLAKAQMQHAARSPLLPARALLSAAARARRTPPSPSAFVPPPTESPELPTRPATSAALLGISLIGDLDRTYARAAYGPGVHLLSVMTASRLKPGGLLLLGHSFGGRLVLQLCWDRMGFAEGEVERFWIALTSAVPEFLC
ncbi:hypothetical protein B0H14DRAFT_3739447 [Mycena olivaceomarginata]|nr:hypothetical protein B0H14DRAFT_3739447 [Mycena olivaceomarginata]